MHASNIDGNDIGNEAALAVSNNLSSLNQLWMSTRYTNTDNNLLDDDACLRVASKVRNPSDLKITSKEYPSQDNNDLSEWCKSQMKRIHKEEADD